MDAFAASRADGSYQKLMNQLTMIQLLILGDWGLEKLNARQTAELLKAIEDRT
ncbi:MAG: ATP-binding protein [Gammaproteobacteria bacterium]|nr:ATP-binding protein [Gammaproteobacteria bacterium]MBT6553180.1 ATP-binding protein [Gammaproteobacteria bacterium]MBT7047315.1 ATP-binding protein [Gammaproteobacteria bacterium]